jgi:hypothetical protein
MRETFSDILVDRAIMLSIQPAPRSTPDCEAQARNGNISALLDLPDLLGLSERDIIVIAVAAGRAALGEWERAYPGLSGPRLAIAAAEAWVVEPSSVASEAAAVASDLARDQTIKVWRGLYPQPAWAGRTAAWVGLAPKYGWQAVAAIYGASKAIGRAATVAAVSNALDLRVDQ